MGSMLKMEDGQATQIIGADQVELTAETLDEALFNVSEVNKDWFGMIFAAQLTDDEFKAAAEFAQVNSKLAGFNVIKQDQLEWSDSNVFKKMCDASLNHVLAIYDKNDLYPVSSAMASLLSMNFAASNSMITLKFKKMPTITADDITKTEYQKAKRLGINIYTLFDTVANLSDSDRKDRKAPPIQAAVKYAGAIHQIDLILNINL
nr:DUF3383 family protein [Mergibacter septicus]